LLLKYQANIYTQIFPVRLGIKEIHHTGNWRGISIDGCQLWWSILHREVLIWCHAVLYLWIIIQTKKMLTH